MVVGVVSGAYPTNPFAAIIQYLRRDKRRDDWQAASKRPNLRLIVTLEKSVGQEKVECRPQCLTTSFMLNPGLILQATSPHLTIVLPVTSRIDPFLSFCGFSPLPPINGELRL